MSKQKGTPADAGLAEELLYERLLSEPDGDFPVVPALMALKNGALMAGFWYEGPDLEAATRSEVGQVCSAIHNALEPLGSLGGWVLHFECIRRRARGYVAASGNAAPIDQLCDEERRDGATYFETHHALFITFLSAKEDGSLLGRAERFARGELTFSELTRTAAADGAAVAETMLEMVRRFEHQMGLLERGLTVGGLRVKRMQTRTDGCELLQALNYVCNGAWQTVRPPPRGAAIDVLLARDLLVQPEGRGVVAEHGGRAYQIVEPVRFPEESWANMLQTLEQLGVEWRRSTRAIFVGTSDAVVQLEEKEKKWDSLRNRLKDIGKDRARPRQAMIEAADQVGEALRDIENGRRFGVHVTNTVIVTAATAAEARDAAREVIRAFQLSGFVAHTQVQNNRQAFIGSFPGHGYHNVRRPFLDSLNLVHLLSLSKEWEGERTIPSRLYPANSPPLMQTRSRSKARFFVNLHQAIGVAGKGAKVGPRSEDAAHAAVFGPIGAGKTSLGNALVSQFLARYPNGKAIFLDNGYGAYKLARARGAQGAHYALGTEGTQLHPFARIHEPRWLAFANDFVARLAQRQGARYGEQERLVVADALKRLCLGRRPEDRSLARLWMDINEPRHLKELVEHFVLGGGKGVIDGERDLLTAARFTCFELGELLRRDETVAEAGIHYVLEWIRTVPDGAPTLLVIDEARLALRDPTIAKSVEELILRGRKENLHVVLMFHSPSQLLDSPLAATLEPNIQTRFWLPNPAARHGKEQAAYRQMGVGDELLSLIETAQRKNDYVYQSGRYTRVFTLDLGPVQRAFWTHDGKSDLDFVRQLEAEYGDLWPREYLERNGMVDAAHRWEKLHGQRQKVRGAA